MMPCCRFTCVKYLNEDGTLNEEVLLAWATETVLSKKPRHIQVSAKAAELVKQVKVGAFGGKRLCTCLCHVIGSKVLH